MQVSTHIGKMEAIDGVPIDIASQSAANSNAAVTNWIINLGSQTPRDISAILDTLSDQEMYVNLIQPSIEQYRSEMHWANCW